MLLFLLPPLLAVSAISVVFDYRNGLATAGDAYDRSLTSSAAALAALVASHDSRTPLDIPHAADAILRTDPVDRIYYAVLDRNGTLLAGDLSLRDKASPDRLGNPSLHDDAIDGRHIRIATYRASGSSGDFTVLIAETTRKRERSAAHTTALVMLSNLVLVMATLVTVFFAVRVALAPLVALGNRIAARRASDLQPIVDARVPGEAQPLVQAINLLMDNVRRAHEAQQSFLSNAAHQLRTPIAGLQTQLELAAGEPAAAAQARLQRLQSGVRRLSHLTNQMLSLARSSPEADLGHEFQRVDLAQLCEDAASEFLDAALARQIDLGFETASAVVAGSPWLLREMLANLIDNAIAYTQAEGHVTVRCGVMDDGQRLLEVEDDGPGIPVEMRERVFERFFRADSGNSVGTGLGLAIVREGADRHHASIQLDTPPSGRGARFRIVFPAPSAAA